MAFHFSKLEDAFKKADDMANANLSNSEAEYQKDHDSWEYERDNLEEARQQWVKDVEEKQKEHDEWLAVNGVAIEEWKNGIYLYSGIQTVDNKAPI